MALQYSQIMETREHSFADGGKLVRTYIPYSLYQ
jgi:hypothetical protein